MVISSSFPRSGTLPGAVAGSRPGVPLFRFPALLYTYRMVQCVSVFRARVSQSQPSTRVSFPPSLFLTSHYSSSPCTYFPDPRPASALPTPAPGLVCRRRGIYLCGNCQFATLAAVSLALDRYRLGRTAAPASGQTATGERTRRGEGRGASCRGRAAAVMGRQGRGRSERFLSNGPCNQRL